MRSINLDELKSIQLDILQNVADFCEVHNITYFLAYGTLIGAIRHNGYIPWDDDIDIAMPRPDYDKFVATYNANLSYLKVVDMTIDDHYGFPFAKVYDSRTIMNEDQYRKDVFGVFVDVFPIDGISDKKQMKRSIFLNKLLNTKKANFTHRSYKKQVEIFLGKIVLLPFSSRFILRLLDDNARKYAFGKTEKAAYVSASYVIQGIVESSVFEETLLHEFEGKMFRIPKGYDQWLRSIYGDYLKLPPEEKRVPQHIFEAWWKE
jgi:lipopolysaccharide cholinephosphotransferase